MRPEVLVNQHTVASLQQQVTRLCRKNSWVTAVRGGPSEALLAMNSCDILHVPEQLPTCGSQQGWQRVLSFHPAAATALSEDDGAFALT